MLAWPPKTIAFHRGAALSLALAAGVGLAATGTGAAIAATAALGIAGVYYAASTARYRARRRLLATAMADADRATLERHVSYYRRLRGDARTRFEDDVRVFLAEQRITAAVGHHVDDDTRLLIAASAAMLTNGWPEWEWPTMRDIVVYPRSFDDAYDVHREGDVAGQVHLHGPIIFSQRDLRFGFRRDDGYHVGVHEMAHVLDMADGAADGIPADGPWASTAPWIDVVAKRLRRLRNRRGGQLLRDYASTNEAELFAVAVEMFFEQPKRFAAHDPELFELLVAYFQQDPRRADR